MTNPGNYRPVSLTSVVCKVFESFVRDALNQKFIDDNLLVNQQFDLTSDRPCTTQLLTVINDWMEALHFFKKPVDIVHQHLQKKC